MVHLNEMVLFENKGGTDGRDSHEKEVVLLEGKHYKKRKHAFPSTMF